MKKFIKHIVYTILSIYYYIDVRLSRKNVIFNFLASNNNNNNIGDQAIFWSENKFFNENFPDRKLIAMNSNYFEYSLFNPCKVPREIDIITISGGGFLGTLWLGLEICYRKILTGCANNKIVVFPQTIYYSNDERGRIELEKTKKAVSRCKRLTIYTRESYSYEFAKENFDSARIELIPDIVMYNHGYHVQGERANALLCFRSDKEQTYDYTKIVSDILTRENIKFSSTDMISPTRINNRNRNCVINNKLEQFEHSAIVFTDRLHAMVFCALTGTPCIVLPSASPKVRGCYEWIKHLRNIKLVKNPEDISYWIKELLNSDSDLYTPDIYKEKFEQLRNSIAA
jgi:pyruvyl transferase EpsI